MDPREQIKSKIDIVQLIQEHIPLKQAGRNFKTVCPFHGEKTPSFVVSPERQIWHCFGCGKGGDIFTFLMEFEKMDFVEALRTLAKRAGVKLADFAPSGADAKKDRLLSINHLASEFYHYLLTKHRAGESALSYLKKRGIDRKIIDAFKIGFAPSRWELLLDFLTKKKGFSQQEVEEAGLIVQSSKFKVQSSKYYDRFRNRIMFTLRDHRGNVVGFSGRTLVDPSTSSGQEEAKYINTPETPLYHKGEQFFGLDMAKEAIKKENQAILVEGEFDMLSSFQAGAANVVALKGTALTPMQAKLIKRFSQNIALAFDVDIAGDAAARRGIEVAENEGLNIKVIRAKEGKDPDEVIQKSGISGWKKAISSAVSVYDFLIDSALSRHDAKTAQGKKNISEEVLPTIATITNEVVKAHFVKRLSRELDVSEEAIGRQMEKVKKEVRPPALAESQPAAPQNRLEVLEEYLLTLLLQKSTQSLIKHVSSSMEKESFGNPALGKIYERLISFFDRGSSFSIAEFVKTLPKELISTVDRLYLFEAEIAEEKVELEIERTIRELQILALRKQIEQLTGKLKEGEAIGDDVVLTALKKQFNNLSSQLSTLTN